ncbi:MAG: rhomboid family intramembrane serine protease, partial [Bacteroidetes bacterium]
MYRVTEVVKHLLIINILMFLGTAWLMGEPTYVYNAAGMPVMR